APSGQGTGRPPAPQRRARMDRAGHPRRRSRLLAGVGPRPEPLAVLRHRDLHERQRRGTFFSKGPPGLGPRAATAAPALRHRPEPYEGGALARFLGDVRNRRILIPRARVARDVLPKILTRRGARVDVVEAYRTVADPEGRRRLRLAVRRRIADAVTFTSPSTVH